MTQQNSQDVTVHENGNGHSNGHVVNRIANVYPVESHHDSMRSEVREGRKMVGESVGAMVSGGIADYRVSQELENLTLDLEALQESLDQIDDVIEGLEQKMKDAKGTFKKRALATRIKAVKAQGNAFMAQMDLILRRKQKIAIQRGANHMDVFGEDDEIDVEAELDDNVEIVKETRTVAKNKETGQYTEKPKAKKRTTKKPAKSRKEKE